MAKNRPAGVLIPSAYRVSLAPIQLATAHFENHVISSHFDPVVIVMSKRALKEISSGHLHDTATSTSRVFPGAKTPNELREKVVLWFYESMLDLVVREWNYIDHEESIIEPSREVSSVDDEELKDFKDLTEEDLERREVSSVEGSKVSLAKKSKKSLSESSRSKIAKKMISGRRTLSGTGSGKRLSKIDEGTSFDADVEMRPADDWLMEDDRSEMVTITYKNGNIYHGPIRQKRFHGYGIFIWSDGTTYEGDFVEGEITGKGKLYYKDLSYYIGNFCKSLLHGEGCMYVVSTNMLYSGEWKAGKKHGKGWLYYGLNNWYEGEWVDDKRHGQGIRSYDKTAMYQGDWVYGIPHGHGTMVWRNNDYYRGDWKFGIMDGYGEYIWKAFFNQVFAFPIINKYEGNWVKGARSGTGVLEFGFYGGARMRGFWIRNMKHGPATVICGNGKTMTGNPLFLYDKPVEPEIWYKTGNREDSIIIPQLSSIGTLDTVYSKNIDRITLSRGSREDVSLSDFPKFTVPNVNPLCIPIHYEPNNVDLDYFLTLFSNKHNLLISSTPSCLTHVDILTNEEYKLRNVIISNNLPLKYFYYQYSVIAVTKKPNFRSVMIRLFLWQLYFDLDISQRGISLIETDLCATKNPNSGLESHHDPFERIHFWQFLQSLITVAWKLYGDTFEIDYEEGTLSKIFRKFIYDDLLPIIGKGRGIALREYRDLLPIQSVYLLYRSIGDPPTARKLYKYCIQKRQLCYERVIEGDEIKYLKPGSNAAAIGATLTYLPEEEGLLSQPPKPGPYPFGHDNVPLRNLNIFANMKRQKLIDCITQVCPMVIRDGFIVNMEYPISFLEFYNIILSAAFIKIDDMFMSKAKKEEADIVQEEQPVKSERTPSKKSLKKEKKK